jgi:glutathione S-transferase
MAKSWSQLGNLSKRMAAVDSMDMRVNGVTNSHTKLRLFGAEEDKARITLYRDNHAWCPYCQKIWLWLEEKKARGLRNATVF